MAATTPDKAARVLAVESLNRVVMSQGDKPYKL
jgi:hypothetical protein